jgi:hypothetical protein
MVVILQPSKKVIEINISLVENEKDGKKEEKEKHKFRIGC